MSGFGMHSFCSSCGAHRREMPFGEMSDFYDTGPCPKCGSFSSEQTVARFKWFRWVDKDGNAVKPAIRDRKAIATEGEQQ